MSDRDDVRKLAEEIRFIVEQHWNGYEDHDRDLIASRIRSFLAEREVEAEQLESDNRSLSEVLDELELERDKARAEVKEQAGQLAALREALELLHACCEHVYYRREDRGHVETHRGPYHSSRGPWSTVEAALATDAGKLEAEVLRAASAVRDLEYSAKFGDPASKWKEDRDKYRHELGRRVDEIVNAVDALQAAKEKS